MTESSKTQNRKAARNIEPRDEISLTIHVSNATVISNVVEGECCKLSVKKFKLSSEPLSASFDGTASIAGTVDDPELLIHVNPSKRIRCFGLNDAERKKAAAAPTEQLTEIMAAKDSNERANAVEQLLATLSDEDKARVLKSISANGGDSDAS